MSDLAASVAANPADIEAALARVTESAPFAGSPRLQSLLRYLVSETLAGRGTRLKGLAIAEAVYAKNVVAEPESDSAVRAEATRLRRALAEYYAGPGTADQIVIEVPRGTFVPVFHHLDSVPGERAVPPHDGDWREHIVPAMSLVVVLALAAMLAWVLTVMPSLTGDKMMPPKVVVAPFAIAQGATPPGLGVGLAADITARLSKFDGFQVYTADTASGGMKALRKNASPDTIYAITGTVQQQDRALHIIVQFVDLHDGTTIWSQSYTRDLSVSGLLDIQKDIAKNIAVVLGAPYGVISAREAARVSPKSTSSFSAYECVLAAMGFFRNFDATKTDRVAACLRQAVADDPDYADAWATLAIFDMTVAAMRVRSQDALARAQDDALHEATHAVMLAPQNAFAQEALATVHFRRGEYAEFDATAKRALALNPDDPMMLADFGNKYYYSGRYRMGLDMVHRALALSPAPPVWYHTIDFLELYRTGDYKAALKALHKVDTIGDVRIAAYRVMTLGRMGGAKAAGPAIAKLFARDPGFEKHAAYYFARWQMNAALTRACLDGLRKAGLVLQVPTTNLPTP